MTSTLVDATKDSLIDQARKTAINAYAPYSGFRVGAVVATDSGAYFGTNVENASYPLGICAERAAISQAVAAGDRDIRAIAVACVDAQSNDSLESLMPCGACRQWFVEFGTQMIILVARPHSGWVEFSLGDLLPNYFSLGRQDK